MSKDILFTRRRFLVGAGAATAALATGAVIGHWTDALSGSTKPSASAASGPGTGPLVLVTLYGGNDGLNTVIPYGDPNYLKLRPNLGYQADQVLPLADQIGFNPALKGLHSMWGAGTLAVVRGVSYPNPVLSHFEGMDIWQTADVVNGSGPGWLGKWLDANSYDPLRALSVGTTLPPVLRGETYAATAITSTRLSLIGSTTLQAAFASMQAAGPDRVGMAAAVAAAGTDLLEAKVRLDKIGAEVGGSTSPGSTSSTSAGSTSSTSPGPTSTGGAAKAGATGKSAYGKASLADEMAVVAALIKAGAPTQVYQVSLSSFDFHSDEKANEEALLGELDNAFTSFFSALDGVKGAENVVVMTYSEFGRRPGENASQGTDHGTAAPLFVAGPKVKGGRFYGDQPSLTSLDPNGNLLHNVDFRSVYTTVLDKVLGADPEKILGGSFPTIGFL